MAAYELGDAQTIDDVLDDRSTQFRELNTVSPKVQIQASSHHELKYSEYQTSTTGSGGVNELLTGDNKPFYELKVSGSGDKATLKSLFRFKYAPSLQMMWGGAAILQSELQSGQVFRFGYFNDTTGIFLKFTSNDTELVFRKGSVDYKTVSRSDWKTNPWSRGGEDFSLTDGGVFRGRGSLYGIGDWTIRGLIPDGSGTGEKSFPDLVEAGVIGESTVSTYNLRVRAELENVNSSASLSAATGEFEAVLLGDFEQSGRQRDVAHWTPGSTSIDDSGDPDGFLAVRHEAGKEDVPFALSRYQARSTSDAHIYTRRVPASSVSLSGWGTPRYKEPDTVAFEEVLTSFTMPTDGSGNMIGQTGPSLDVPSSGNSKSSGESMSVFNSFRIPDGYYLLFAAETEPGSTNTDPLAKLTYEMKELP